MADPDEMLVSLSNYRTFWGVATRNHSRVESLVHDRDSIPENHEMTDDDIDFVCEKNAEIQRAAMVTVAFSLMTLESYINEYGIQLSSGSYFDNYLDKLDTRSKWVVIPRLFTHKQINTDAESFELLRELIALRNRIVHDKTRKKRICDMTESDWVTETDARKAVKTVRGLVTELQRLDRNIETDWLEKAESDPLA